MGRRRELYLRRRRPYSAGLHPGLTRSGKPGGHGDLEEASRRRRRKERHRKDLRAFAGQLIELLERERNRISRDLHDAVNQQVGLLAFELDLLGHQLPSSKQAIRDRLRILKDRAAMLAQDIRRLAHGLHPSILDHQGLESALREHIRQTEAACRTVIQFSARNVPRTLSPEAALCLYRAAQERLGNALKHADAKLIRVELAGFRKSVRLIVQDDGKGFPMALLRKPGKGLGFVSIQERARLVNGRCTVRSKPGRGTLISLSVPCRPPSASPGKPARDTDQPPARART